jgi:cell division protein FtsA
VILVGGGAKISGIIDLAKDKLKLNVQIGYPQNIDGLVDKVDDPSFATAVGLIHRALEIREKGGGGIGVLSSGHGIFSKIIKIFRKFLP